MSPLVESIAFTFLVLQALLGDRCIDRALTSAPPPTLYLLQVGKCLNYDEVAVYDEDAALPTFLIVYSMGA